MGYSWPRVFLLGASGRTWRFFTQLLFHLPISVGLRLKPLELKVAWIVLFTYILLLYDKPCML